MAKAKGVTSGAMKSVGRNMARANNQKSSAKVPMKYAKGGNVKAPKEMVPPAGKMGSMNGMGMDDSGFGSGTARGGKAQTKGKAFKGSF
jgi:hypothetical protein